MSLQARGTMPSVRSTEQTKLRLDIRRTDDVELLEHIVLCIYSLKGCTLINHVKEVMSKGAYGFSFGDDQYARKYSYPPWRTLCESY